MDTLLNALHFPDRSLFKRVDIMPMYIEPRVGSGERICVGAVAFRDGVSKFEVVSNLKKLRCLYGIAYTGLIMAGQLALKSFSTQVLRDGFDIAAQRWQSPATGIFLGEPLTTSSSSLEDALNVSLGQFSSLYSEPDDVDERPETDGRLASLRGFYLERLVKETTLLLRPDFEKRFGQKRRIKDGARPMRLGYIGEKLVANFGLLSPKSLSATVNTSKAKLWDLAQAREGTQTGWFDFGTATAEFELFVQRSAFDELIFTSKQKSDIAEAMEELETEADKLEVRCRSVTSPVEIARYLVAAEA